MGYIFISYSHKDKDYVHKLHEALQKEGFDAWIDDRIDYGDEWMKVIQKHIDESDAFVIVMSKNSFESDMVQNETARARDKKKPIFPILLDGENWLIVQAKQYVDVSDGSLPPEKFHERLSHHSSRHKTKITSPTKSTTAESIESLGVNDKVENEIVQRFPYLKRLYELSSGDTLAYFQFTEIGNELGWTDETTDRITDYLRDDGLIEFPSFGTVSITHSGVKFVENALRKSNLSAHASTNIASNPLSYETQHQTPPVNKEFLRPKIPIEIDSQEVIRFFAYVESALDERFKTLENAGLAIHKTVNTADKYSYQVRFKNNLVYHFSMRRREDGDLHISFLDGWSEPISENAATAFGTIFATLDDPTPRIQITNLSMLETTIRSAEL